VLGEYRVVAVVGEGGFGIVYRCEHLRLGNEVAIKEYMPAAIASRVQTGHVSVLSGRHRESFDAGLRSFVNEAQLLTRFDHPALVKVRHFWEANGTAYMVMPYYAGVTLAQAIARRGEAPSEAWLCKLLDGLLDALELIHREDIYHRDIAPDNILLQADDRPVLLDFGAARRAIADFTQNFTVILKPGYAPIEQYGESGAARQGAWTDLYALAATLYYCITGKRPTDAVSRLQEDTLVPLAVAARGRYSASLLAALDRALAVSAADRPQSVEAFRVALAAPVAGGERQPRLPGSAPDGKKPDSSVPSSSRKKFVIVAAVVIALLSVAALVRFGRHEQSNATQDKKAVAAAARSSVPVSKATDSKPPPHKPMVTVPPEVQLYNLAVEARNAWLGRIQSQRDTFEWYVHPERGPGSSVTGYQIGVDEKFLHPLQSRLREAASALSGDAVAVAALRFVEAVSDWARFAADAAPYYKNQDYRDDRYVRGRKLHPQLFELFNAIEREAATLRAAMESAAAPHRASTLERLRSSGRLRERAAREYIAHAEQIMRFLDQETRQKNQDLYRVDVRQFRALLDPLEAMLAALQKPDVDAKGEIPAERLDGFATTADAFFGRLKFVWRAVRDQDRTEITMVSIRGDHLRREYNKLVSSANGLLPKDERQWLNMAQILDVKSLDQSYDRFWGRAPSGLR